MADNTPIEWTDATWNPVTGCSIATAGCTNCYAMRTAARIEAIDAAAGRVGHYAGTTKKVKGRPVWTGKIGVAPDHIFTAPLRWRSPRTVFVNSMSDLFHEDVPDAVIDRVFAVMALSPQHTFQVLTKRSARMREYLSDPATTDRVKRAYEAIVKEASGFDAAAEGLAAHIHWPLPTVWLGVSAERQQEADERVPDLLATPAAIRFVSAEPLLGPIDFTALDADGESEIDGLNPCSWADEIANWRDTDPDWEEQFLDWYGLAEMPSSGKIHPTLDWIIVGGESGTGARPMHPEWARSIRDQCAAAGVPFFFKQWGAWAPGECVSEPVKRTEEIATWWEGGSTGPHWQYGRLTPRESEETHIDDQPDLYRVGKKRAGRLLDGVEHNGFPEIREVPFG